MTARERIVSIFDREIRLLAAGKKYKNRIAENELEQIKKVFSRAIDTEQEKLSSDDIYRMIRLNS